MQRFMGVGCRLNNLNNIYPHGGYLVFRVLTFFSLAPFFQTEPTFLELSHSCISVFPLLRLIAYPLKVTQKVFEALLTSRSTAWHQNPSERNLTMGGQKYG